MHTRGRTASEKGVGMEAVADSADSAAQMSFEGIEISGMTLGLKSATGLACGTPLAIGDEITGYVEGVVVGINHFRSKDGVLVRHHTVEVVRYLSQAE